MQVETLEMVTQKGRHLPGLKILKELVFVVIEERTSRGDSIDEGVC